MGAGLLKKYPTVECDECLAVISMVATTLRTDIANVEARHASIRIFQVSRSLQTHRVDVQDLSEAWLFQQIRTGNQTAGTGRSDR